MAGNVGTLEETAGGRGPKFWIFGLLPLVLLAGLLALFGVVGPAGIFEAAFPPIEELTIERISFTEDGIGVEVVNGGPEEVTIAQVTVDEAVWQFTAEPDAVLGRLDRATLTIPYPWSEGEPHTVVLISAGGVMFEKVAEVAALSPQPDGRYFATFTLLGVYVGVIPVMMGLLWYPFLRRLADRWLNFFLSFTVGLLLFLGIDAADEALEFADGVAAAFQGVALVAGGILLAFLAVSAVDRSRTAVAGAPGASTLVLVYSIAVGIGSAQSGRRAGDRGGVHWRVDRAGDDAGGGVRGAQHDGRAGDRGAAGADGRPGLAAGEASGGGRADRRNAGDSGDVAGWIRVLADMVDALPGGRGGSDFPGGVADHADDGDEAGRFGVRDAQRGRGRAGNPGHVRHRVAAGRVARLRRVAAGTFNRRLNEYGRRLTVARTRAENAWRSGAITQGISIETFDRVAGGGELAAAVANRGDLGPGGGGVVVGVGESVRQRCQH